MPTKTIVFIHGLFMNNRCWDQWVSHYAAQGYTCLAPAWPGRDLPVATLRQQHPDPKLAQLTLDEVIEQYVKTIAALPEKPIVIGHSMGGLIAQILLQRGLVAGGVAIDSAPPAGVVTLKWSFIKANWPLFSPFTSTKKPYLLSFEQFQYAFVNAMPLAEQKAAYETYVVPESVLAARGPLGKLAKIDFKQAHTPLLLIAGGSDHIIPASLNQSNYEKYKTSASVTDFKEFPQRNHYLIAQPGWEEIADYTHDWLSRQAL